MDGTVLVMDYSGFEIKKIKYILSSIGNFDFIEISDVNRFYSSFNELSNLTLIIMDLAFPTEKEGFSLLASIRNSSHLKDTPVIITSKSDNVEYRNAALKLLANDYIQKPYKPSRLESSVRSIIKIEKRFSYPVDESAKIIMSFEEYFAKELNMAKRTRRCLSIILITLIKPKEEKLKNIENITEIMDKAYSIAIDKVKKSLRVTDYAVLNNKDIIVVLPNTDPSGALVVNEKISLYIDVGLNSIDIKFDDFFFSTCVTYPEDGSDFQSLMERAIKSVTEKEMLEKFTNILDETKVYARSRYNQFKK